MAKKISAIALMRPKSRVKSARAAWKEVAASTKLKPSQVKAAHTAKAWLWVLKTTKKKTTKKKSTRKNPTKKKTTKKKATKKNPTKKKTTKKKTTKKKTGKKKTGNPKRKGPKRVIHVLSSRKQTGVFVGLVRSMRVRTASGALIDRVPARKVAVMFGKRLFLFNRLPRGEFTLPESIELFKGLQVVSITYTLKGRGGREFVHEFKKFPRWDSNPGNFRYDIVAPLVWSKQRGFTS